MKNLEINLDINISKNQEKVYNDEIRYKQILLNLLSNALKCTLKGFIKITIKTGPTQSSLFTIVEDTGIGISKEQQQKLFQFYYSNFEDEIQHGVGLGLAIAK